jgi:hypothetical protein
MKIVQCGKCTESFPEYLFEFGIAFRCACGAIVDRSENARRTSPARSAQARSPELPRPSKLTIEAVEPPPPPPDSEPPIDLDEQDRRARELRRRADRICYLIVSTDRPLREIEAEMQVLRARCRRYFPEIRGAYEQVYEARFQKLWREFR